LNRGEDTCGEMNRDDGYPAQIDDYRQRETVQGVSELKMSASNRHPPSAFSEPRHTCPGRDGERPIEQNDFVPVTAQPPATPNSNAWLHAASSNSLRGAPAASWSTISAGGETRPTVRSR
jgi:hypothetical protein